LRASTNRSATQAAGVKRRRPSDRQGREQQEQPLHHNGLDRTDPVSNTFSANLQQDAPREHRGHENGRLEANTTRFGSVINLQTKRGTNTFHGAASAYWSPKWLVDSRRGVHRSTDQAKGWDYKRRRSPQARIRRTRPAGPIIKDHLFFNAAFSTKVELGDARGPPRNVQSPSRVFNSYELRPVDDVRQLARQSIHTPEFIAN